MNIKKKISLALLCSLFVGCSSSKDLSQNIAQCIIDKDFENIKSLNYDETIKSQMEQGIDSLEQTMKLMGDYQQTLSIQDNVISLEYDKAIIDVQYALNKDDEIKSFVVQPKRKKDVVMPTTIEEKELNLKTGDYELAGTLTVPKNKKNYPIVILVHGSGPSDQDETLNENKPFRDISWALAKQGIGSYRYDKRTKTYASQLATQKDLDIYDETIDDVVSAVHMLKEHIPSSRLFILGHSLGGYVMPRIAREVDDVDGYIMMSAPVSSLLDLMLEQVQFLSELDGKVSSQEQLQINGYQQQINKIKNHDTNDQLMLGAYQKYWDFFLEYDPIKEAQDMKKPVLVLQGDEDYQVPLEEYHKWEKAFSKQWIFHHYPQLNHLMMTGLKKDGSLSYLVPNTVDQRVIDDIAEFINKK